MKVFQSFRLDPANQCLWRGGHRVPLTPKAFDVLRYLVEHPGRLVTQDELLGALWPETYVNPELIKKYILGIRKVLGDRMTIPSALKLSPSAGINLLRLSLTTSLKARRICHPTTHQRWLDGQVLWVNFRLRSRKPCVVSGRSFLLLVSRVSEKPRSWIRFIARFSSGECKNSAWTVR